LVILIASICLLKNLRPPLRDGLALRLGTGLGAGFLSGASSLGGMLASVMLFAVELPAKSLRATLVLMFFFSSLYSLAWGLYHGVVNTQTATLATALTVPLLLGVAIGTRGFSAVSAEQFKRYVLVVLALLSVGGLISVALGR
jgi:uncharacterized membrane protein YfcA